MRCGGAEVSQARAEWADAMRCARREVGPNREHEQLQVALLALSVEDGGQAEFAGEAALEQMRRLVSGFVEEDVEQHGGGTKARKGMWRLVRESGLRVQRAGKEVAKQLEADIV